MFRYGPGEQIFRIQPNRVLASSTFTTLEWTIRSVTGGAGSTRPRVPPFAEPVAAGVEPADPVTASGPVLVAETGPGNRTLRTRMVRFDGPDPRAAASVSAVRCGDGRRCCSRPDKAVTVVTTYPPLPAGTDRVQVRFRGLGTMSVPVNAGAERAPPQQRSAPVVADDLAARRRAFRAWVGVRGLADARPVRGPTAGPVTGSTRAIPAISPDNPIKDKFSR